MKTLYLQNWKFNMDKGLNSPRVDPWSPSFDDSNWDNVIVPHDWAVSFPFSKKWSSGTGYLPGGTGWYRTSFQIPEDLLQLQHDENQAVFIYFDGVYKNSQVWCNGYHLGKRPNGYIGFRYDISHCLQKGRNTITVKVSHEDFADSRWYTGSGIYRKAYINFCAYPYIDDRTVVVQSKSKDGKTDICLTGEVTGKWKKTLQITACLEDKNISKAEISLQASCYSDCQPVSFKIDIELANPQLWSPENPNLYTLYMEVREEGTDKIVSATQPIKIGIRNIRFCPDKGFFLNDVPYKIRGVCVHHDAGALGAAVWPDVWRRRLEKLKDMGCNAIRASHNPHMNELYDLCDEMGFLVMDEAFDEWEGCKNKWSTGHNVYPPVHQGYAFDFPQWHQQDLEDMVIRGRNRPSIIMWSIGNEIDYPNDPYVHPLFAEMTGNNDANKPKQEMMYNPDKPNMKRLSVIAAKLVGIVKKQDATRPVLVAAAFPELSAQLGFLDALDIAGYNYKEHLYEADHKRYPKLPFLGSECHHSIYAWKMAEQNEYISGQFLWTGIDYLGEAQGWPIRGSGAGLLDLAGYEKIAYYRRKALWSNKPFVYLASRPKSEAMASEAETYPWELFRNWDYIPGQPIEVICYTNLSDTELFCNGKSCGRGTLNKDFMYTSWVVPFERGVLKVTGIEKETGIMDTIESTLPPVRLKLNEWQSKLTCAGVGKYRIAQIEVQMLDEADRLCTKASQIVSVSLDTTSPDNESKILGMENGNLADCTEYSSLKRQLYGGRLIVYVLVSEPAWLTAKVEGMLPVVISL